MKLIVVKSLCERPAVVCGITHWWIKLILQQPKNMMRPVALISSILPFWSFKMTDVILYVQIKLQISLWICDFWLIKWNQAEFLCCRTDPIIDATKMHFLLVLAVHNIVLYNVKLVKYLVKYSHGVCRSSSYWPRWLKPFSHLGPTGSSKVKCPSGVLPCCRGTCSGYRAN